MTRKNRVDNTDIKEKIQSIGVDLNIVASLMKFLDVGLNEQFDIKKSDVENLISVINFSMKEITKEQNKLENLLEL
ncbi:hypothetical protein IJD44_01680 [bacterium]|nr:hypothetical protein [bacterium]